MPRGWINIAGEHFGMLIALCIDYRDGPKTYWKCICECGRLTTVILAQLRFGHTKSCGCRKKGHLKDPLTGRSCTTHDMTGTPEHNCWAQMLYRCRNPHARGYKNYGGRDITVCAGWLLFDNFLTDMGLRPSPKHSIDRKDNNGGYWCGHCNDCVANNHPANCRWAIGKIQHNNKRSNRLITFNGQTLTTTQWAERTGLSNTALGRRIEQSHWPLEKALNEPARQPTTITFNGETHTINEWATIAKINEDTLKSRLYHGWSTDRALSEIVHLKSVQGKR